MFMLRYLAVVSTMLTLPVFCFAQSSPVPAYNPGFQGQAPMMPANYGPMARPGMAMPSQPMTPMAAPTPTPMAAPMMATTPNVGVSSNLSDFGAMSGMAPSYDVGGESYFDSGSCGSVDGDCCGMGAGCFGGGGGCLSKLTGCGKGYLSIFGGVSDLEQQRSTGFERDLLLDFEEGYALGIAHGKRVGRFFRSELEYTYRSQDPYQSQFDTGLLVTPIVDSNPSGNQDVHSGMFNLFFDMIVGHGNLVPYIGGGIGVGFIDSSINLSNGQLDGDDTSLAYQWMAGITYRAKPNLELFVEYRYFEVEDPKLNFFGGNPINFRTPNILLNSEYQSTDVFAGFRFNF